MRRPIVLLPLVAMISLAALAARAAELAFVINSGAASISVIDTATRQELRRIPVKREPHHVVLSPDGKSLLIGDTAGNEVVFLDPVTGEIQKRVPVSDPYHLGFSPDGKFLVVNGLARNQVDVHDAVSMALIKRFKVVATPSHLAFSPDSASVYITLQESNRLLAIDLIHMTERWNEPVGKTPAGVLWHNGKLLVANMGTDYIAQVDPADGRVLAKIQTGKGAHTIFPSPDRKLLWVNNRAGGTTVALDAATLKQVHAYTVPGGPDDIEFAPDGKLWITRRWAESVAVMDPATGTFQTIAVGRSPHGLWLRQHPAAR